MNAIDVFKSLVHPASTRIISLPDIVLVFGGKLGASEESARQMFINWLLVNQHPISRLLRTPEQYEDWNNFEGYDNLIDFEREAGSLAKAIVLFSESPGAFAELGAFCMDSILAERLFVVIDEQNYAAGSFIAHGPIKKIENHHGGVVCAVSKMDPPKDILPELDLVADALSEKINSIPQTTIFNPKQLRDRLLLVMDLVELFGAITVHELQAIMQFMGGDVNRPALERLVKQAERFELISSVKKLAKTYLVSPADRQVYLDYRAKVGEPAFDRTRFKFKTSIPWLKKDSPRRQAYLEIHPGGLP